jgi:hypothetical protein
MGNGDIKNTLICAGGSGSRVLMPFIHLAAMGWGPDEVRLLVIDPDKSNGNFTEVSKLLEIYNKLRDRFSNLDKKLFNTKFTMINANNDNKNDILIPWSPIEQDKKSLSDIIYYQKLDKPFQDLVHCFFTEEELNLQLDIGFQGHPTIGAACMSLLSMRDDKVWKHLIDKIDVDSYDSKVVIVASVFGGTGASSIYPVAKFLKEKLQDKVKIGVIALVPYFRFDENKSDISAKAKYFPLATRSAAEFYDSMKSYGDWPFDAMFWVGDSSQMQVGFSKGGPGQNNPPHFVELISAIWTLEYFKKPIEDGKCYYSGPRQIDGENTFGWEDIPFIDSTNREKFEKSMLEFTIAGIYHKEFNDKILNDNRIMEKAYCVPWFYKLFNGRLDKQFLSDLSLLTDYFRNYYFVWLSELHKIDACKLFKKQGFDLDILGNILAEKSFNKNSPVIVDSFFNDMVKNAYSDKLDGKGASLYLNLLFKAADSFINREYFGKKDNGGKNE